MRPKTISTLAVVALALIGTAATARAGGPTYTIPCGNIALLQTAVGTPGATINLASGCVYHLAAPQFTSSVDGTQDDDLPVVTGSVTINGHGATLAAISPASGYPGRILEVGTYGGGTPGYLTLNSVTLIGGSVITEFGGGGLFINTSSTAILNGSSVKKNTVRGDCGSCGGADGGGIFNDGGALTLNSSQVSGNTTPDEDGSVGGGIFSSGSLSLNHTKVSGNTSFEGGGIYAISWGTPITLALVNSQVTGNKVITTAISLAVANSAPLGGGIWFGGATLYISNSTVSGNGISNQSGGCLGCGFANSEGGGIFVFGGNVTINASRIRNNTAATKDPDPGVVAEGGGLFNSGGTVSFTGGSVVEGNTAINNAGGSADGGGIFNDITRNGTVTLSRTTVTLNTPDNCEPEGTISGCQG